MRFQALLLCLVVIIALLFSPARKAVFENTDSLNMQGETPAVQEIQEKNLETDLKNPFSIFLKDFYFFLGEKINLTGKNLIFAAENFQQNLSVMKNILSGNFNGFLSDSSERDNEGNPENPSSLSYALVSKAEINTPDVFPCSSLDKPDLTSEVVLVDYLDPLSDTDEPIFKSSAQKRWPIASLTKLMTGVIVLEKMDLEGAIVMSENAVATEGTIGDFKAGEIFGIEDLLKAMLVSSSNDAAVAIAESFGKAELGSSENERNFINEMQRKAAELGMFSTTFLEPTGLSYINQSTAEDLAKLAAYVYSQHPEILEISRQKELVITELRSNKQRKIYNIDKFAGEEDFIGGKTGFIDEAGRNLVAFFEINNRLILIVILGSEDAFEETETIKGILKDCQ